MLLVFVLGLLQAPDVDGLLRALADEDPKTRDRASAGFVERWRTWTDADLAKLRQAAGGQGELGGRSRDALRTIDLRRKLGPALLDRFKDLDRVVLAGSPEARGVALLQAAKAWRRADLETVEVRALAEAMVMHGFEPEPGPLLERLVPPLSPLLRPWLQRPERREAAIEQFARLNARAHQGELRALLEDGSLVVRARALRLLASWGVKEAEAVALPWLGAKEPEVRAAAVEALASLGAKDHAARVAALLDDPDRSVRTEAAWAVGSLGFREAAPKVAPLLRDDDGTTRMAGIRALARLGAKDHAAKILALVPTAGGWEGHEIKDALDELGVESLREPLLRYATGPDGKLRWIGFELLVRVEPDLPLQFLKHENPEVRASAAWALTWRARKSDSGTFVALLKDSSPGVRRAALEGLAGGGATDRAAEVAELLGDADPIVRATAAESLARLGARSYAEPVAAHLKDDELRISAVGALGSMGARRYARELAARIRDGSELRALADMGAREEAEAVRSALKNEDFAWRDTALRTLSELGGVVEDFTSHLRDRDGQVVQAALAALGRIGSDAAVRSLEDATRGNERFHAARALLETGRPEALSKVLPLFGELGNDERVWLAREVARWTARGIEPPDRAGFVRFLARMDEDSESSFHDAAAFARVGLGMAAPATLKDSLDRMPEEARFSVLACAHARESFPKLYRSFKLEKDVASPKALEEALRQQGVTVEVDDAYYFDGTVREETVTTGMRLIDRLGRRYREHRAYIPTTGIVVDGGVIRIVLEDEARRFWRKKVGAP